MDDAGIIELFWSRDETAIAETSGRYGPYLRGLAMRLLGDSRDAEECEQDTYMALWNAIPPERPGSLRAYLGGTARNIAVNIWQRRGAKKRGGSVTQLLGELSECVPSAGDAQTALEDRELGRAISSWLSGLDRDSRALFLRRYWYGEELKTLARKWGVPANRLAQRMYRLRAELRAYLEKEGYTV